MAPREGSSAPGALPTSTEGCDLSGRWLVVVREVATAVGAQAAGHEWLYYEIRQSGTSLTVTKGLSCGHDVTALSGLSANADDPDVWPAMLTKCSQTGRTGASEVVGSQCRVSFDRFYQVVGATLPDYLDPSLPLPDASQPASAGGHGWEDWDDDANPGVTRQLSGSVTGKIYLVTRRWNAWSGSIAEGSNTFTIANDWSSEIALLGYEGSALLSQAASGTKDNDSSLHVVTFARLGPTQALGDDAAACGAVRSLAPMLAPEASN
jgi:hypothetical protein